MLSKEAIFDIMRNNPDHKLWSLYIISGLDKRLISFYNPENHEQSSIDYLNSQLQHYANVPNVKFHLEIKTSEKANGSGKLGPYEFTVFQQVQQQNNISGLGSIDGYMPLGAVNQMIQAASKESELRMQQLLLNQEKQRFEEEKKEYEKELKDKSEKADNQAYIAGKGLLFAIDKVVEAYSGENPKLSGLASKDNSNNNNTSHRETEAEPTPEESASTEIAQLFADAAIPAEAILKFKKIAQDYIDKIKLVIEKSKQEENVTKDN